MTKATRSIGRKLNAFARSHKGVDGETGRPIGNTYQGTAAVLDVDALDAEDARRRGVLAAETAVLAKPL